MDDFEKPKFPSGRKRGSVKCGLKSKVNIPKGGATPKYPAKPMKTNELDKVFASLKSAQAMQINPEARSAENGKSGGTHLNHNQQKEETNERIFGTVAKLLQTLEPKSNFKTLPQNSTLEKPVVAPRKVKSIGKDIGSQNYSFEKGCEKESTEKDLKPKLDINREKPKPPSKPLPVTAKPSLGPKPGFSQKPNTSLKNNVDRNQTAASTLQELPVKRLPIEKFTAFDPLKPTPKKRSIKRVGDTTIKSYNKAPPPPARPPKQKPSPPKLQAQVPPAQCAIPASAEVCAFEDEYELLPERTPSTQSDGLENEWSDVSEGGVSEKETKENRPHKHLTLKKGSSRSRRESRKHETGRKSSSKKHARASNKSTASYTDAASLQELKSSSEWETDEELNLVDSQGYEDVEKIRQIALRAVRMLEKQATTSDSSSTMARSEVNVEAGSFKVSRDVETDISKVQLRGQQSHEDTHTFPKASKIKQKRTSVGRKSSPKLPPKVVPKLPPKAEPRLSTPKGGVSFRLSQEVPVPVESRSSTHYYGDKKSSTPHAMPRTNSTSVLGDHPPEVPRRRAKTNPGFAENPKLSQELGLIRERDSSGYLIPIDIPADDNSAPPPPLPPKGASFAVGSPNTPPTPPKLPVKSRTSSRISELDDDPPPLLPRKNADKRNSIPNNEFKVPPTQENGNTCSPGSSRMSSAIPAPRDSLLGPGGQYVDYDPPPPNANMKYLTMDKQKSKSVCSVEGDTPPPLVPRPALHLQVPPARSRGNSETDYLASPKGHGYLKLLQEADDDCSTPGSPDPSLFSEEPLYQIYHCGAVLRDVMTNEIEDMADNDDIYDDAETVKGYVSNILSRVGSDSSTETGSVKLAPSSLEHAALTSQSAGMRTLWAEMKQVKDSGVLDSIDPSDKKLQEAIFEILTSEASYLKSLDVLVTHFMAAPELDLLKTTCVIKKRDQQVLFSNVYRVRSVSKRFLNALEQVWKRSCMLDANEVCDLVAQFTQKHFDVYVKYCSNQVYQDRKLLELKKVNVEFCEAVRRIEGSPVCQGLTLQSFLTMPMQRITRLPLLVDAMCHRMDSEKPNYEGVTACLHTLQKLVKQCNEGARRMNNLEQVAEIDKMLDFKHAKRVAVVSQSRSLVKKGAITRILSTTSSGILDKLKRKKETLHIYLFNDLMLITKKKNEDCYQVIDHDARINIQADIISTAKAASYPTTNKNLFKMALLGMKTEYIFATESESERMRWVEAVTPVQQQSEHERVYETWDCPQVQAVHQYSAQQPDELSLEESDVINVHRKMTDGWYEGERIRDGETGWFPSTHVVEIQSSHVRARNLRQRYRMLQMSHDQFADMLQNPQEAWKE